MKWLITQDPQVGYLVTEITEERLDGIAKISAHLLGMYSLVETNTVHVLIPNGIENHHEVFPTIPQAQAYIQNHVLSPPHD